MAKNCYKNFTKIEPTKLVGVRKTQCSEKIECKNIRKGISTFVQKTDKSIKAIRNLAKSLDNANRDFAIAEIAFQSAQAALAAATIAASVACFFFFFSCAITGALAAGSAAITVASIT